MEPSKLLEEDETMKVEEKPIQINHDGIISTPKENGDEMKIETTNSIKQEKTLDPEFVLTTKNLERVREDLRQEEVLQGRKSPVKDLPASSFGTPIKSENVSLGNNHLFRK